jgi:hypothetical protein
MVVNIDSYDKIKIKKVWRQRKVWYSLEKAMKTQKSK